MANLRVLKKDIDFLISEVISDCWTFMYLFPDKKQEEASKIINDTIDLRSNFFLQSNNPDKDNLKKYYQALRKNVLVEVDALFIRISELNKAE